MASNIHQALGIGAARFRGASVSCRFGTIAPITVSMLSGDEIVCTSPALAPGVVTVGIPAPRLFGDAAEYQVAGAYTCSLFSST